MRLRRNLEAFVSLVFCRLEVRRQQVPAVALRRCQFREHIGVIGFAAGALPIPGNRIVAGVLPLEHGQAPDQVDSHLPAAEHAGTCADS